MTVFIVILIFGVLIFLAIAATRSNLARHTKQCKTVEDAIYSFKSKLEEAVRSDSNDLELWKALTRLHRALSVMVYKTFYVNEDLSVQTDVNKDAIIWFRKLVLPKQMQDIIDLDIEDI